MLIVALLWVAFCLNYVDRQVAFSIYPALRSDLGFSAAELGWVGTVFLWSYSLTIPLAGRLADKGKPRRLIVTSLALWSLAMGGTAFAGSVGSFLFWRGVMGVTEALYFPAAVSLIAALHGEGSRSRALGWHQSAQLFGAAAGGWFGGWSADNLGWRTAFAGLALLGILYAPVLGFVLPEGKISTASGKGVWSGRFVALVVAFFAYCGVLWVLYAWLPNHLGTRFGLSMTEAGWRGTLFLQASSFVGILVGGWVGDRTGKRFELAMAGMVGSPLVAYAVFAATSLEGTAMAAVVFGLGAGLVMSNVFAAAFETVGADKRGWAAGILNMLGGLAGGLGMLLFRAR